MSGWLILGWLAALYIVGLTAWRLVILAAWSVRQGIEAGRRLTSRW